MTRRVGVRESFRLHRIPLSLVSAALAVLAALWLAVATTESQAAEEGIFPHERSDLPKKKNATAGRYLYLGTAPRFEPEDLELVSSKIGLTLRVTARVPTELRDQYALLLLDRYKKIANAFLGNENLRFVPYQDLAKLESRAKSAGVRLWLKIAAPHAGHVLQGQGVALDEKRDVLTALIRYYFQDPTLTPDSLAQLESSLQDPLVLHALSRRLFEAHLGPRFAAEESVHPKSGKAYIGYLHYVYPIAATVEGPFDQPGEGVREFGLSGNIESRIWSEKWEDEFGGFPFLLVEWSGVAFHGPITNYAPLDIWYLRRDYVSHGCHRMDASDLLELRAILPANLSQLQTLRRPIRHVTLNWPDVADLDRDGRLEVVDVAYYDLPTWVPEPRKGADLDAIAQKYLGEAAAASWRKKHYLKYNRHANAQGTPVYDPLTGLYTGLPRYEIEKGRLVRRGTHEPLSVTTVRHQPNRILQYRDGRAMPKGFENRSGKYAPPYFAE